MKKRLFSIAAVLAALFVVAATVLSSCGADTVPADSSAGEKAETTSPADIPLVILNGDEPYRLIRGENAPKTVRESFAALGTFLRNDAGWADLALFDDFVAGAAGKETVKNEDREIIVGDTNRAESAAAAEALGDDRGYLIRADGKKIVIYGSDEWECIAAIGHFRSLVICRDGKVFVPEELDVRHVFGDDGTSVGLMKRIGTVVVSGTSERMKNGAEELRAFLKEIAGEEPELVLLARSAATVDSGVPEILVGGTNRVEDDSVTGLHYLDYVVTVKGNKIIVKGGSPFSTVTAVRALIDAAQKDLLPMDREEFTLSYTFADARADSLMFRMDGFEPVWKNEFTPSPWMTDMDEKLVAIYANRRACASSHRGDSDHYPENSAEAILSAAMMGADSIEIDVRLTKDGVPILMHDATLGRMTDVERFVGVKGCPASTMVEDWTYEQLLMLSLKLNGVKTESRICTLYEAAALVKGRCFLHIDDKTGSVELNTDVYALGADLGAKTSFIYYYTYPKLQNWLAFDTSDTQFAADMATVRSASATPGFSLARRNYEFVAQNGDNEKAWLASKETGYNMVFTGHILKLMKFIQKNYSSAK